MKFMKKNKKLGILLGLAIIFSINGSVFAYDLSQEYPAIGGISPSDGVDFFVYAINLFIALGALIALGGLIYQGYTILTAGENAGKVTEAKRKIKGLVFGLFILVSSFTMLTAINPELNKMDLPILDDLIFTNTPLPDNINPESSPVTYTEVPIGAIIESILNAVSTSPTQAYNYSSVKIKAGVSINGKNSTEEICYLYDKYGNAIDKNGDGQITELDEYQGLDFSICINELLKAVEHKLLYLNGGNYRCGIPGNNDEDSPLGNPDITNWNENPLIKSYNKYSSLTTDYKEEGRTALDINYHDWDKENWVDLVNGNEPGNTVTQYISTKDRCRYWGKCENDGITGIVNNLKEYIRNGCVCSETDADTINLTDPTYVGCEGTGGGGEAPVRSTYCLPKSGCANYWCDDGCNSGTGPGCSGGPRGRNLTSQTGMFNNILANDNPYYQHDPCLKRKSMDCMREFINDVIYGDMTINQSCKAQEKKVAPGEPIKMGWQCDDFSNFYDPEIEKAKSTEFLLAYYQRLISFKSYYENRIKDLEKAEKILVKDKRLEVYSKAELQELQQSNSKAYNFDQSEVNLLFPFETTAYRRRFNCSLYEDSNQLNKKNVYENDEYRAEVFTCDWAEDDYNQTQKDNRLITIKTGDFISNLHVDKSMEATGDSSEDLGDDEEDTRLCARGEMATLKDENTLFSNFKSSCAGGIDKSSIKLQGPTMAKKRFVQWKEDLFTDGSIAYLDQSENKYYTGEDMAINGDPLTFYILKSPSTVVDPYYTGRDKMPSYFQTAFIDYTQYSENSAIDTEVGAERGFLIPSLIPVGQLSYHTKIYAKQMIRNIDKTLEQMEAAIISLDNIANVYTEGYYKGISDISNNTDSPAAITQNGDYSPGCDCKNCHNSSNCHCTLYCEECTGACPSCCCGTWYCDNKCSACTTSSQTICATCSKVSRYTYFLTPTYITYYGKSNAEPMVEDVIDDNLPNSLKFIVHDMSCPYPKEYNATLAAKSYTGYVKNQYEEKEAGKAIIDWDGEKQVLISSCEKSTCNVTVDDYLVIENKINGKSKTYGSGVWSGYVDIMDILSTGKNDLHFIVKDRWGGLISWTNIYVLVEKPAEGTCLCNKAGSTYTPPQGYKIRECNAWDRELKEERSCDDHKNDIVVYLERDK